MSEIKQRPTVIEVEEKIDKIVIEKGNSCSDQVAPVVKIYSKKLLKGDNSDLKNAKIAEGGLERQKLKKKNHLERDSSIKFRKLLQGIDFDSFENHPETFKKNIGSVLIKFQETQQEGNRHKKN